MEFILENAKIYIWNALTVNLTTKEKNKMHMRMNVVSDKIVDSAIKNSRKMTFRLMSYLNVKIDWSHANCVKTKILSRNYTIIIKIKLVRNHI